MTEAFARKEVDVLVGTQLLVQGPALPPVPLAGVVDADAVTALRGVVPETELDDGILGGEEALVDLLVATGLATSRRDARQTIDGGGLTVNGHRVDPGARTGAEPIAGGFLLVQKGRRTRHLVVLRPA